MRFNGDDLTVSEAVVSSAIDSKPSLAAMPASQRVPRPLRSPGPFSFYSPELKPRFQLCPSLPPLPPPGQEDSPDPNLEFRSSKYSRGTRRRYSELCTRLNKHESSAGRPACASYERKSVRRSHASRVEASRGESSVVSSRGTRSFPLDARSPLLLRRENERVSAENDRNDRFSPCVSSLRMDNVIYAVNH